MRYQLTITTWGHRPMINITRHYANLTPARAWKLARRAARRGFNRFGGDIVQSNWGMRGGAFPFCYVSATITLHRMTESCLTAWCPPDISRETDRLDQQPHRHD